MSGVTSPIDPAQVAEREMLARLVTGEEDAEGLIAYALHRRALLDWLDAFEAAENRAPDAGELKLFLLGETAERRLRAYRERAALMLAADEPEPEIRPALTMPARKPPLRTWFWPWGLSTGFAVDNPDQPLNWRGLLWRLFLLGLAVSVTALALRIFVVRA